MTAVWRSGAEVPEVTYGEFSGGAGAVSFDTAIKRSGSYALKYTGVGYLLTTTGLNLTGAALRAYIYITTLPATASRILGFLNAAGSHFTSVRLLTDGTLQLVANGPPAAMVGMAISPFAVAPNTWGYLEVWLDRTTGILATRYNGIEWARTHIAAFAASGNIDGAYWGPDEAALTGSTIYYDDLAMNSLVGAYNNAWPGPSAGGVLTLRPNATGEVLGWTALGAPTIHECLDDLVPDLATTYILQSGGISGAAAAVFFPAWPMLESASCVMLGMLGSADAATGLTVTFRDPNDFALDGLTTLAPGWQRRYPVVTAERAWDGTRRLLNNGYLIPSSTTTSDSRVIIIRTDSLAAQQYITTLWMTVDFPLVLAAAPVPVGVQSPAVLAVVL